jgi:hypothetical protein
MSDKKEAVDMEFVRSVAEEPAGEGESDNVGEDRHYGGSPDGESNAATADEEREKHEWESRYGTEESRDKLGFDGGS